MRATLEGFEVARARRLDDVLARFAEGGWSALAGGTDLMVTLGALALAPCRLVDVWAVPELRGITVHDDVVVLGALTTYADVQAHPLLVAEFPMLVAAARLSGAAAIQNRPSSPRREAPYMTRSNPGTARIRPSSRPAQSSTRVASTAPTVGNPTSVSGPARRPGPR